MLCLGKEHVIASKPRKIILLGQSPIRAKHLQAICQEIDLRTARITYNLEAANWRTLQIVLMQKDRETAIGPFATHQRRGGVFHIDFQTAEVSPMGHNAARQTEEPVDQVHLMDLR